MDWADFRGDSVGKSWLEVYTSVRQERFRFVFDQTQPAYVASLRVCVTVTDTAGAAVDSVGYSAPIVVPPNEPVTRQMRIINLYPFELPPGRYSVEVLVEDILGGRSDTAEINVELRNFWTDTFEASGIMLAYTAKPTDEESNLVRFGRKMYPNPQARFDLNYPVVYYYVEFYFPRPLGRRLLVRRRIFSADTVFREFEPVWRNFPLDGGAYIGGFSVAGFPDGEYTLEVGIADEGGAVLASAKRKFLVAKKPRVPKTTVSRDAVERMRDILYYLLAPEQLKAFDELTPDEKLAFWTKFWASKDPDPKTPENEFKDEYIARWEYANKAFGNAQTPGWRTDEGRIYILYGPPDNIERHSMDFSSNQWEVWSYFEENYFFVFADVLGTGVMKLVHSNVDGEVHDPYWREHIVNPPGATYQETR